MNRQESMTSTKNQNDPRKKHRFGTVSKILLLDPRNIAQSMASDQVLLSLLAKIHVFFMY